MGKEQRQQRGMLNSFVTIETMINNVPQQFNEET